MLPRGLSCSLLFCYEFVESHFLFSFYSPYVILLRIVLLFLKNITRETGVADYYNIILLRLKPIGPYLPLSRGKKFSSLGGCMDSVKFGTPCQRRSV